MKIFFKPTAACSPPAQHWSSAISPTRLTAIARDGPQAFYEGAIADKIVAAIHAGGGMMTARRSQELSARSSAPPVHGRYRGYDILSMPPSSSGGVILIEMLNILEGYPNLAKR